MNRPQRIAAQLGMPQGTAQNKLRKQLLYKFVRMANQHWCHACGAEIESVDQLSIEHKLPWEGRDTELFWDLDNIAFSHKACNTPHVRNTSKLHLGAETTRKCSDGTKWCWVCQSCLTLDNFTSNKSMFDGKEKICRACRKTRGR